jgi:hypothetical protein
LMRWLRGLGRAWPRGVSAVEAVGEDGEKRCVSVCEWSFGEVFYPAV